MTTSETASELAPDLTPGPATRQDAWKILGPGGGGTMVAPTLSPHDPNIVVEHCDMTGAYITTDGARSWRMFNLRSVVATFAFDPHDPQVIYAGNAALWRSEDIGKTWRMLFPDPTRHTVERMLGDHADLAFSTDDPTYPSSGKSIMIQAIAVDPADSRTLYIAFGPKAEQPSSLYRSRDRGATWTRLTQFAREPVLSITIAPAGMPDASPVYVVAGTGIYMGQDDQWQHRPAPEEQPILSATAGMDPVSQTLRFYVTTPIRHQDNTLTGGIYGTEDGGRTWRDLSAPLLENPALPEAQARPGFRAIACASVEGMTAYVGFRNLRLGTGDQSLYNGIAKTTDGGQHWTICHQEGDKPASNMDVSWIESRAVAGDQNIWFDDPYSLGVAPTDPKICYATDLFRTYRTLDGGTTWQQVNSVRQADGHWTTRGLDVTTCYGVHFDPFDKQHLFITYTDIGLFQSLDGGKTWIGSTEGIPSHWRNTTYWIALDPAVKDLLWGAFALNHDLPRPKMWRQQNPANYQGGVAVSTDGGRHWTLSSTGMPESAVTHLLLDPTSPVGQRTLYACAFGRGVYKSTDNGLSWTLKNQGIMGDQPFAWRLTRADDGILYLVVARRSEDGGSEGGGALYCSTDEAEHWTPMALPAGVDGPTALIIDPSDPQRLYLTAWGHVSGLDDAGGGVFVSADGGQTWKTIFDRAQHVYDLEIDPQDPQRLYLCGFDTAAYRSIDQGVTWSRIQGYNFKWGHRVLLDQADPTKIYITTYGGSVWHGPAAGDPHAVEDTVPPLDWRRD